MRVLIHSLTHHRVYIIPNAHVPSVASIIVDSPLWQCGTGGFGLNAPNQEEKKMVHHPQTSGTKKRTRENYQPDINRFGKR